MSKDAFDLYHKQQHTPRSSILNGPALPALGHAMAGSTGTAISNIAIYPLNLVITRLQVQRQLRNSSTVPDEGEYKGVVDAFKQIYYKEGGLRALYAGVIPDTTKSIADSFLFFLFYNYLRTERLQRKGTKGSTLPAIDELIVGSLAGAASKLFTTPIANVVTRKQTASLLSSRSKSPSRDPSVAEIINSIQNEKGLQGFWSGYSASLVLTLNPSLTFFLYETFKRTLLPRSRREDPGAQVTFLMAAVSKAIASTITYPFSVAKTRAQISSSPPVDPDSAEEIKTDISSIENKADAKAAGQEVKRVTKRSTVFATILKIYREEGLEGCYEGVCGEILKGFLGHGITMIVKERVHQLIIQAYYWVLKSLNKYPSPSEIASQASQSVSEGYESVAQGVGSVVESGKGGLNSTYEGGKNVVNAGVEKVSGVVTDGTQAISSTVSNGAERVGNVSTNAVSGVVTGEKLASEEAGHLLGNAQEQLGDKLVQVGSEIKPKDS